MKKEKLPRGLRRRGNAFVACFARADGTIERRSLGNLPLAIAKEKLYKFKSEVRLGEYETKTPRKDVVTVRDLWEVYKVDFQDRGRKDARRLQFCWNQLARSFANKRVNEVTTQMVHEYIASRRVGITEPQEILSRNGTINREVCTLHAMFRLGASRTPPMVEHIPKFPKLKESPAKKGFVTDPQYAVLARNAKTLWMRALIACYYTFGFRRSEMLNLRVGQVDFMDRTIELAEGETKNDDGRKVHMTTEVFDLLVECCRGKNPADLVFTRDDGSRILDFRRDWFDLCVASNLGEYLPATGRNGRYRRYVGLHLHDFRRSAIRNMVRRGVLQSVAMKISGHKTASVFQRYNITDETDLAEASRKIELGRQTHAFESDTKTDTAIFQESQNPRKSLN
jgi:integrase